MRGALYAVPAHPGDTLPRYIASHKRPLHTVQRALGLRELSHHKIGRHSVGGQALIAPRSPAGAPGPAWPSVAAEHRAIRQGGLGSDTAPSASLETALNTNARHLGTEGRG